MARIKTSNALSKSVGVLSILLMAGVAGLGMIGVHRLRESAGIEANNPRAVHKSQERVDMLTRLSKAIVLQRDEAPAIDACVELRNVKTALDTRLAALRTGGKPVVTSTYVLDLPKFPLNANEDCPGLAKGLEEEANRSWRLLTVPDAWRENAYNKGKQSFWQGRYWVPHFADLETADAWEMIPGCITSHGQPVGGVCQQQPVTRLAGLIDDPQMNQILGSRLLRVARTQSGRTIDYHGKQIPVGHDIALTLTADMQARAVKASRCYTGHTEDCAGVLPSHLVGDWHFQPGALAAGAAAILVVHASSGNVIAVASDVSSCSLAHLNRQPTTIRDTRTGRTRLPLFQPGAGELCAQIPGANGRAAYLTISPIFWLLGFGSTHKTFAMLAGIEAGVVSATDDDANRLMLARSNIQVVPQRIAIQAASTYSALLDRLGFTGRGEGAVDPVTGETLTDPGDLRRIEVRRGMTIKPFHIDIATYQSIRAAKAAGKNADRLFGRQVVAEYLKAYELGISAIGSGDIRHSVWGLADWTRRLVLRAEGASAMPATHLAILDDQAPQQISLDFAAPASVRRLNWMLNAVTSSRLRGTAAGSCRKVFGQCPPDGHPAILFGKTGTAETGAGGEASPWVKEGGAGTPPAKLFMMAFRGNDGELYVAAAMTLRIRENPNSSLPELHSNSAAELAMLAAQPLMTARK